MATTEWQPSFKKMFSHHSLCKLLCFCGAALCTLPPGVLFVCPQRAYKHPGKGRQKKNREREETVSVKLMFSPLLSSPLCWNPSSFHLAAALVMNYALGSCEIRQESTPTLLRCVCVCMCAQGGLTIKPTSEVVDYEEERCLSTIFHLFFVSP